LPLTLSRASEGSPASPAVLVGSAPLSVKVAPPSVDWANPVNLLLLALDPESLKATTTVEPARTRLVSLCVSLLPVSAAGLLTSTLVYDSSVRSSRASRKGRADPGRGRRER